METTSTTMKTTKVRTTTIEIKAIGTTIDTSSLPAIIRLKITGIHNQEERDVNLRVTTYKIMVDIIVVKIREITMKAKHKTDLKPIINQLQNIHNKDHQRELMKIISTKHRELKVDPKILKFTLIQQRSQFCKILGV